MSLSNLVHQIRTERNLKQEVPDFDPQNGNELAKYLFLLEAPGPKAVQTGYISFENPDPTARNLRDQLTAAGIIRAEIALWNIVPWYIGKADVTSIRAATSADISDGIMYLKPLISLMPALKCVVLVGAAARQAHMHLSSVTTARIVCCHHPSARVVNVNINAARENVEIFRFIKSTT